MLKMRPTVTKLQEKRRIDFVELCARAGWWGAGQFVKMSGHEGIWYVGDFVLFGEVRELRLCS